MFGAAEAFGHGRGEFDSAPYRYEVDVDRGTVEKYVAHITSDHIDLAAHLVGYPAYVPEHGMLQTGS